MEIKIADIAGNFLSGELVDPEVLQLKEFKLNCLSYLSRLQIPDTLQVQERAFYDKCSKLKMHLKPQGGFGKHADSFILYKRQKCTISVTQAEHIKIFFKGKWLQY